MQIWITGNNMYVPLNTCFTQRDQIYIRSDYLFGKIPKLVLHGTRKKRRVLHGTSFSFVSQHMRFFIGTNLNSHMLP